MSEERELILKMLEEGTITAEQAAELLEACDDQYEMIVDELDSSAIEFSEADTVVTDQNFAESMSALGEVLKSVDVSSLLGGLIGGVSNGIKVEKTVEGELPDTDVLSIELEGRHGELNIVPWEQQGFKAQIKARVRTTESKAQEVLEQHLIAKCAKNALIIGPKEEEPSTGFQKRMLAALDIELYVPVNKVYAMKLKSSHGRISVQDFGVEALNAHTSHAPIILTNIKCEHGTVALKSSHGRIELTNIEAATIEAKTSHARIVTSGCKTPDALLHTSHGPIEVDVAGENINAQTSHGSISLIIDRVKRGNIKLNTTHGSIEITGNVADEVGIELSGEALGGKVHIDNPCFSGTAKGKEVCLRSANFNSATDRLLIQTKTSHSSITFR